jgi:hypothetical protein
MKIFDSGFKAHFLKYKNFSLWKDSRFFNLILEVKIPL